MKTNIKNLYLLLFCVMTISLICSPNVMGAYTSNGVSWVVPTTGSGVLNGQRLGVINVTTFAYLSNCTFYAQSASTANSSWVILNTTVAINDSFTSVNSTFISSNLEDSNDYYLNATCRNISNDIADAVISSVRVDNTVPVIPSSLVPAASSIKTDVSVTFSATVGGNSTTGCILIFQNKNPGSSSYAMTHSGNTCTYALTNVPAETYTYLIRASDGSNTTDSASTPFMINIKNGAGNIVKFANQPGVKLTGGAGYSITGSQSPISTDKVLGIAVVGLLIGIVVYFFFIKR